MFDEIVDIEDIMKNPNQIGYIVGHGQKDGIHINAKGGQVLADYIYKSIFRKFGSKQEGEGLWAKNISH